jgi:PPM family protein phosphatase
MNPNSGFDLAPRVAPKDTQPREITIASKTEASRKHPDVNEDSFAHSQRKDGTTIALVCDGVGGMVAGDQASKVAREDLLTRFQQLPEGVSSTVVVTSIKDALSRVHQRVREAGSGGQTTATVVVVCNSETRLGEKVAVIGNVGDSRVYLFRDGKLEQRTIDDSESNARLPESEAKNLQDKLSRATQEESLSPEDLAAYHSRNVITQALGGDEIIAPRITGVDLRDGDRLFICSDGISDPLTTQEMEAILALNPDPQIAMDKLIEAVKTRNNTSSMRAKEDDKTGIIIDIPKLTERKSTMQVVQPEIQEPTFKIEPGMTVYVPKKNGTEIQEGWTVVLREDPKTHKVRVNFADSKEGGILYKDVDVETLRELNRPTLSEDIKAINFTDAPTPLERRARIIRVVRRLKDGGLQGSKSFYQSEQLVKELQALFEHPTQDGLNMLTNSGNLREKVRELLNIELVEDELRRK